MKHDNVKTAIRYVLSGRAWDTMLENRTAFTTNKDYGKQEPEAQWAHAQSTLHGLHPPETNLFQEKSTYRELSKTPRHVEGVIKLKEILLPKIS